MKSISALVDRLPSGVRDRPAWIFIGFIYVIVGIGYSTGYNDSIISQVIGHVPLRIWGALDVVVGTMVVVATIRGKPAFERFTLRCLALLTLTYSGWLIVALDFDLKRGASSVAFGLLLALATQLRVRSLSIYMESARKLAQDLQRINDRD